MHYTNCTLNIVAHPQSWSGPLYVMKHCTYIMFLLFTLLCRIHVWDLSKSDIYPLYTVPFGTVSAMQLSPDVGDAKTPPHLVSTTSWYKKILVMKQSDI
jgi:hypothetical protein